MKTQEKNEACYTIAHEGKNIKMSFEYDGRKYDIQQRRLTGKDKALYSNDVQKITTNRAIYDSIKLDAELKSKLEIAQKKAIDEAKKIGEEPKPVTIDVPEDAQFIMHTGGIEMQRHNRENEARFIAYSCCDSFFDRGYFKVDGEELNFDEMVQVISELDFDEENKVDYFKILLGNANKLTYATKKEVADAK